jgi:hypothetical protein
MATQNEFYEGESEEEFDIEKENEKLCQQLLEGLGAPSKEEKSLKKELGIVKAFKTFSKLKPNKPQIKDIELKPQSQKSLCSRINELQNELNNVYKEINDYIQIYGDNSLIKEENNYNEIIKDLELYSSKLNDIISSDLYKDSISGKYKITTDANQLKNEIKKNLEFYTNSASRLLNLLSEEKEDYMIQSNVSSVTHEIHMNKKLLENQSNIDANNIDKEILEIEKELTKIENVLGKKKLNKNEEISMTKTLKQLIKTVDDEKLKYFKEKNGLTQLSGVLDELLLEKEKIIDISEYSLKIKELHAIYEIYENYDEILNYIKKRLMAICDMHEKSVNFNSDLEFLKKLIEDNEKQFTALGNRYNETFDELGGLDEILKELKSIDQYFAPLLID